MTPKTLSPAEVLAVMEGLRLLAKPHMLVSDHERYVAAYMAIQSAFAELEARQWRGMESAPKDGTVVDLWSRHCGRLCNVYWRRGCDVEPDCPTRLLRDGWRHTGETRGNSCLIEEQFTHWTMPLPTPPHEPV